MFIKRYQNKKIYKYVHVFRAGWNFLTMCIYENNRFKK